MWVDMAIKMKTKEEKKVPSPSSGMPIAARQKPIPLKSGNIPLQANIEREETKDINKALKSIFGAKARDPKTWIIDSSVASLTQNVAHALSLSRNQLL